ncbi:MAG: transporter substrate-binding domain-containing protein [Lentisphaeraceae bacterium]|nr:transporter substrate-binding domain-containing protein [Lentisphaeraceae bacterium]
MKELLHLFCLCCFIFSCGEVENKKVAQDINKQSKKAENANDLVLASGEWAPYCGENLAGGGISTQIISAAFREVGIKTRYRYFNWSRALEQAIQGECSGSIVWYKTPGREKNFYFSESIHRIDVAIFYRKEMDFDWLEVSDLQNYKIAATRSYEYGSEFSEAEKNGLLQVERGDDDLSAFRKLVGGRTDLFVCAREVGMRILGEHFSESERNSVVYHSLPLFSNDVHLMLSRKIPKNKELIKLFNEGLVMLRRSGELSKYHEQLTSLPVIFMGSGTNPPATGAHLPGGGISTVFLGRALRLTGNHLSTRFYPWKRCETLALQGTLEGLFSYFSTEERRKKYYFSEEFIQSSASFYYRNDTSKVIPEIHTEEDLIKLNGLRIVSLRGYYMSETLRKAGVKFTELDKTEQLVEMVYSGRADLVVAMDFEFLYYKKLLYPQQQELLSSLRAPWWDGGLRVMIPKNHPSALQTLDKVNKAIKIAKEKKLMDEILLEQGVQLKPVK